MISERENINPSWRAGGVSVAGVSHQKAHLSCQDSYCIVMGEDSRLIIAVSDGAGSAAFAEVASELTARTATQFLAKRESGEWLEEANTSALLEAAFAEALRALEAEAESREVSLREFACTLLLVVATPEGLFAAQIGDGAIVVQEKEGSLIAVTTPQNGEHANETTFLVSPNALEKLQVEAFPQPFSHLAVFTDGLQRLALRLPEATPFAPFFTPLFRFLDTTPEAEERQSALTEFLCSPRVTAKADDDLTLVLASWIE